MTDRTNSPAGESVSPMVEESLELERRWLAALDHPAIRAKGLCAEAVRSVLAEARARVLDRLLLAVTREQLLGDLPIGPPVDGRLVLPLPQSGRSLVIECPDWTGTWLFQRFGRVWLEDGDRRTAIERPVELVAVLAAETDKQAVDNFNRFAREIGDAVLNDGLCTAYRSSWNRRIAADLDTGQDGVFWRWLTRDRAAADPTLFLEQWGAVGHNYHSTHKTKLGLQPSEVVAWSPEFEGRVGVRLAAVRRARIHVETMRDAGSIEDCLENYLPDWFAAWQVRLRTDGFDPADFVPVPVHPWQADNVLPGAFADAIARNEVVLLDGPEIECVPTMSFRTVVPSSRAGMPHIKLPIAVRLTSVMRTISPRSSEMGPRVSQLLQDILAEDDKFDGRLAIVPEEIGIHYCDEDDSDLGKHLGALIRTNPARCIAVDEIAVPSSSLLVPCPGSRTPLFVDIARAAGATSPADTQRAFRTYVEMLLGGTIRLYLVYGIGLEAHMQNTLAVFNADGRLRRVLVRDFGGIRIHRSTLTQSGRALRLHADRLTVVESREEVRDKFINVVLQQHLGWLPGTLACNDIAAVRAYWSEIAGSVEAAFDAARGDVPADLWHSERRAFLDDDWRFKANTRMRILDTEHDIFGSGRNPLAAQR